MNKRDRMYLKKVETYYKRCTLEFLVVNFYIEENSHEPGILERVVKEKLLKNKKEKAKLRKKILKIYEEKTE